MPITWRNVGSTVSNSGGSSLMEGAQESMTSGFDALQKVLNNRQKTNRKNYGTNQENMVADYLDRVAQASSVEDVGGLRGDAELQAMRDQLNGRYAGQVRGAVDERETDVIEQTQARQKHSDSEWMRDNQEALVGIERMAINGNLDGAIEQVESMGVPGGVGLVRELQESFQSGDDQRIQQARLAIAQTAQNQQTYTFNRGVAQDEQNDAADAFMRDLHRRSPELLEEMSASELKQRGIEGLMDATDMTKSEAVARYDKGDAAMVAGQAPSALDTQAYAGEVADLADSHGVSENYERPSVEEAGTTATRILDSFKDEDGNHFGSSDPEERLEIERETAELLRTGIKVDGIQYYPDEGEIKGALAGVGEGIFDYRPRGAMKDYIQNSPGMTTQAKARAAFLADVNLLNTEQESVLGDTYSNDAVSASAERRIQRALKEAEEDGAELTPEQKAAIERRVLNDSIPFR